MLPPNWFNKKRLGKKIPKELEGIIKNTKRQKTKLQALKYVYNELSKRYWGGNFNTIYRFMQMYKCNINHIAKEKGFMHCTKLNYLIRFILVKSNKFKNKDIKQKLIWCGHIFPHQYLQIKIDENKKVNVDLWGKRYGIKFGEYVKKFPKKL